MRDYTTSADTTVADVPTHIEEFVTRHDRVVPRDLPVHIEEFASRHDAWVPSPGGDYNA